MIRCWTRGEYTISTDPGRLDLDLIHAFLTRSYWAEGRPRERVALSIERSLPFGVYHASGQVGFARVVTDHVVVAYLADVFVLETHRGRGLGTPVTRTASTGASASPISPPASCSRGATRTATGGRRDGVGPAARDLAGPRPLS